MGWTVDGKIEKILEKGGSLDGLSEKEAVLLLSLPLGSREVYALMETANRISRKRFGRKGENHFHIGLNASPCPFNCSFCSLAQKTGVYTESVEFSHEEIVRWAKWGESRSADALNIMTTGTYSFDRLLEVGRLLSREVSTPLVANTRDINHAEGEALLKAG